MKERVFVYSNLSYAKRVTETKNKINKKYSLLYVHFGMIEKVGKLVLYKIGEMWNFLHNSLVRRVIPNSFGKIILFITRLSENILKSS